jgi:hypothetical protein
MSDTGVSSVNGTFNAAGDKNDWLLKNDVKKYAPSSSQFVALEFAIKLFNKHVLYAATNWTDVGRIFWPDNPRTTPNKCSNGSWLRLRVSMYLMPLFPKVSHNLRTFLIVTLHFYRGRRRDNLSLFLKN